MELIIIIVAIIAIIIVNSMMKINVKQLEKIALDSELNEITKRYPKNIEHITKAIKERKETVKQQEEQSIKKDYIPKEIYQTNNLFVATISCNKELVSAFNLPNDILNQKFI